MFRKFELEDRQGNMHIVVKFSTTWPGEGALPQSLEIVNGYPAYYSGCSSCDRQRRAPLSSMPIAD
jgi:hypothetical protein